MYPKHLRLALNQQCLQGRNFVNKLWNAYKLINSWTVDNNLQQPTYSQQAIEWFTKTLIGKMKYLLKKFALQVLSEISLKEKCLNLWVIHRTRLI